MISGCLSVELLCAHQILDGNHSSENQKIIKKNINKKRNNILQHKIEDKKHSLVIYNRKRDRKLWNKRSCKKEKKRKQKKKMTKRYIKREQENER